MRGLTDVRLANRVTEMVNVREVLRWLLFCLSKPAGSFDARPARYFSQFVYTLQLLPIFADSFESGTTGAWSSCGGC